MPFQDFLKLCTTIRCLYDKKLATDFFEKNIGQYYKLGDFDPKKTVVKPLTL